VSFRKICLSSAELVLTLPPLRERGDKKPLIRHIFAQESAAPGRELERRPGGYACAPIPGREISANCGTSCAG